MFPRPEPPRLMALARAAARIAGGPPRRILEKPDRPNPPVRAEVKPVPGAARHTNQVAGLDFDGDHRAASRPDVEQTAALQNEPDFILIVPMLAVEFGQHGVEPRLWRRDVNHVRGDVASARLELFNFSPVSGETGLGRRPGRHRVFRLPALVMDADGSEVLPDGLCVIQNTVLIGKFNDGHGLLPPCLPPKKSR